MTSAHQTIVLITGANQGIGYATAEQLFQQNNYYILLGSRDAEKGAKAAAELDPSGKSVEPITIDVADDESIQQAADHIASKYGRIDVLINNAGINNELARYLKQQDADKENKPDLPALRQTYRDAYEINLFGAAITTEAFIPLLEKAAAKPARIVFVSSHTGSIGLRVDQSSTFYEKMSQPSFPIYRSSKTAMNMLTLHYAARFKEQGWKINASCPNLTRSAFSRFSDLGRSPAESAVNIVRLATLSEGGETGQYSDENGVVAW
ncbi:hypothetical protein N7520_009924 [Penicillium odoratum]|uniref:uncharacterized protein n=1 Tax=Penicillium odoratum TaxID=1167516 RepID=UPI002547D75C|nr:uncharacterized protein N7520_009924 [Penicillium odoratum]KAJ5753007.1 hypothetical protein N7520_009924 [Penicillium odoratum]